MSTRLTRGANPELGADYYDRTFAENDHWQLHYTESEYYSLWSVIVDRIRTGSGSSVLDLGCGPGQFARYVSDQGIAHYVGLDFSGARIARARQICPEYQFVEADVNRSDLVERLGYDTVVCTEFLEHIQGDLEVVSRIPPGVRLLATVPNFGGPGHVRHFKSREEVHDRYGHLIPGLRVDEHRTSTSEFWYYVLDGWRAETQRLGV